jgi:hypothetical protein
MGKWLEYYNGRRLHAALFHLLPEDVFAGRMGLRLAERKEKSHTAYITRRSYRQVQAVKL